MVLYSAVSSPLDRSKRFTLYTHPHPIVISLITLDCTSSLEWPQSPHRFWGGRFFDLIKEPRMHLIIFDHFKMCDTACWNKEIHMDTKITGLAGTVVYVLRITT